MTQNATFSILIKTLECVNILAGSYIEVEKYAKSSTSSSHRGDDILKLLFSGSPALG